MKKSKYFQDSHKIIGSYLKEKREEAGLSQVFVASELGCKPQYICNWERGATTPPWDYMRVIVKLYKMSPKELYDFLLEIQTKELRKNLGLTKQAK